MPSTEKGAEASVLQLKVTLLGIEPPIWRRIQVPSSISLGNLHSILQVVMGWESDHLHEFLKGTEHFGPVDEELGSDDMDDEDVTLVRDVLPRAKSKLVYLYDFGDSWEHEVLLEKSLPLEPDTHYPVCLEGARASPPEDCGGAWGYAELLEIVKNPKHEQHEERLAWLGPEFDPDAFDAAKVNRHLKAFKIRK